MFLAQTTKEALNNIKLANSMHAIKGAAASEWYLQQDVRLNYRVHAKIETATASGDCRVGRGAEALGARCAKKRRPRLGRGALQNFGGAEIQNQCSAYRY